MLRAEDWLGTARPYRAGIVRHGEVRPGMARQCRFSEKIIMGLKRKAQAIRISGDNYDRTVKESGMYGMCIMDFQGALLAAWQELSSAGKVRAMQQAGTWKKNEDKKFRKENGSETQ